MIALSFGDVTSGRQRPLADEIATQNKLDDELI
jgi:hypothetical protein